MNQKIGVDIYTLSCVKQTTSRKLLCNREPSLAPCDDLKGGLGERRKAHEGLEIHVYM